jgi:hypothetical protein
MDRAPFSLVLLGLVGCFSPASPSQRLTESAYNMNTATRFGRMDVAIEHVGAAAKEAWAKKHAAWGKSLRIVDLEFGGMSFKDKGTLAEVFISVTWQRLDEADARVTGVTQRWVDVRGTWSLVSEEEKDGDGGLLEEVAKANDAPIAAQRYQTRVIHEVEE